MTNKKVTSAAMIRAKQAMGLCVLGVGLSLSAPSSARAQSAERNTVNSVSKQINKLEALYLTPELLNAKFPIETRYQDGRIAYELGQYGRASILFLDVLTKAPKSYSEYRGVLYFLASSLMKQRNFNGARNYFRDVIEMGRGEYYNESLESLLRIAYGTGRYDDVEELYVKLNIQSTDQPALQYLRAKTLFEQQKYEAARALFMKAAKQPQLLHKATYYAAVTLVTDGRGEDAERVFSELYDLPANRAEDVAIKQLCLLSLGRLAYERGAFSEAVNYYAQIPPTDDHVVEALYESAWANLRLKEYAIAEQKLDLLEVEQSDLEMYTKSLLLRAKLAQLTKDYDEAILAFDGVLTQYNPVARQLDKFVADHEDLRGYFVGLVRDDLTMDVPSELPSLKTNYNVITAREWLQADEQTQRAKKLVDDVGVAMIQVDDAYDDLTQVEARLNSGSRLKSFPKLAQGLALAVSLESSLVSVQEKVMSKMATRVVPNLSGADAATWQGIEGKLQTLAMRYADVPGTLDELNSREEQVVVDFKRMRRKLGDVGKEIDGYRAELAAVETYEQTQAEPLPQESKVQIKALKVELRSLLEQLEKERKALRLELETTRQSIGTGNVVSSSEQGLRALYMSTLNEAIAFLSPRGGSKGELDGLSRDVANLYATLQGYYKKMNQVADQRIAGFKTTVTTTRQMLSSQRKDLKDIAKSSRVVAGELALMTFVRKRQQFDRIILRADVGKTNVLFVRKEQTTQRINELFKRRTDELRMLQESFEEVR